MSTFRKCLPAAGRDGRSPSRLGEGPCPGRCLGQVIVTHRGGRGEGLRPQHGPLKPGCGRKTHKEEPVLFADHWEGIVNDIRTKGNSGLKS